MLPVCRHLSLTFHRSTRHAARLALVAPLTLILWGCGDGGVSTIDSLPGQPVWDLVAVPHVPSSPKLIETGRQLYGIRCAVCHGENQDGQGPASVSLSTPPRDFLSEGFKLRSPSSSSFPSPDDLFRTITAGFPAYGMPPFNYLPAEDRWALVYYTMEASGRFENRRPGEPVDIGIDPGPGSERLTLGRQAFDKAQCRMCHGEDGRGFGPSAEGLRDGKDRPIRTLDLTSPATYYKRGARARDIMLTLASGLAGTPMPSYFESGLTSDELWSLAYYVESLVGERGTGSE